MTWFRHEATAPDHPKMLKLARKLDVEQALAHGLMANLWCWALSYAPDGDLSRYDIDDLELAARWKGNRGAFFSAILEVGFVDAEGSRLHDWMQRSGALHAAQRQATYRARKGDVASPLCDSDVTVTSPLCDSDVTVTSPLCDSDVTRACAPARARTIRYDTTRKEKKEVCSEPCSGSDPAPVEAVIELPTNRHTTKGETYCVSTNQVAEWSKLYPVVDVEQELRTMKGWLDANTTKRKTLAGMPRFVNAWLSKEQDKGGNQRTPVHEQPSEPLEPSPDYRATIDLMGRVPHLVQAAKKRAGLNGETINPALSASQLLAFKAALESLRQEQEAAA